MQYNARILENKKGCTSIVAYYETIYTCISITSHSNQWSAKQWMHRYSLTVLILLFVIVLILFKFKITIHVDDKTKTIVFFVLLIQPQFAVYQTN